MSCDPMSWLGRDVRLVRAGVEGVVERVVLNRYSLEVELRVEYYWDGTVHTVSAWPSEVEVL